MFQNRWCFIMAECDPKREKERIPDNPQQQIEKRLFMPGMTKIWKIQQPAVLCLVTLNNHILDILKDSVLRYDALIK